MARTLQEVEKEIQEVENQLKNVHGTETEVYARIVGYYRAIRNWNNGKKDEYKNRKLFEMNSETEATPKAETNEEFHTQSNIIENKVVTENKSQDSSITYEMFTRKTCPNCPAVKEYMQNTSLQGINIDVDTEEGFNQAAHKGVFASPTVIFYDSDKQEIYRAHTVEELTEIFETISVSA